MKIYRVKLTTDDGKIANGEAIKREGKLWLVSHWLDMPDGVPNDKAEEP